ncbi:LuxR C-terminal-related transcriptional regulator [Bradyrhizobium sp. NAS96.2]|uniref:LuxR C-terminal-related transcriptional regulator n=1 Tax=Bradyrhizobium sp. NAS96.2 TaxID=1680160 RepID=UPI001FD8B263|nr:LuxR C-terminal-related transcriptional regulator [Bradyrhizobium sp. NAS96.2]
MRAIGEAWQTQSASAADGTVKRNAEARLADLSPLERDVLRDLVAGTINKAIAHDLGISPRTLEVY